MKVRKALELLLAWTKETGGTVWIPDRTGSYRLKAGDLGTAYWGDIGFRSFNGSKARHLPRFLSALSRTDHLLVSQSPGRENWVYVDKDEFLAQINGQMQTLP